MHWPYDVVSNRKPQDSFTSCHDCCRNHEISFLSPRSTEITDVVSLQLCHLWRLTEITALHSSPLLRKAPFPRLLHYGAEQHSRKDTLDVYSPESANCTGYILETIILIEVRDLLPQSHATKVLKLFDN